MALFTIGDLHLSLGADKPMDVFHGWDNYVERLAKHWQTMVQPDDMVVLAGDTSWAMHLQECEADFSFIDSLPGKKLLLKGNHDYWWSTLSKMQAYVEQNNFSTIHFLHNNSFSHNGFAVCGTRGWMYETGETHNDKILNREAGRLRASLQQAEQFYPQDEKIVFLHYPPVSTTQTIDVFIDIMQKHGVKQCFYGHLHANAIRFAVQGDVGGICYKLISADSLAFKPYKVTGQKV